MCPAPFFSTDSAAQKTADSPEAACGATEGMVKGWYDDDDDDDDDDCCLSFVVCGLWILTVSVDLSL